MTTTCQVCGRSIKLVSHLIAHHGYQRPGDGFQTASCPGARQLPYEVSRLFLGQYIVNLRSQERVYQQIKYEVRREQRPATLVLNIHVPGLAQPRRLTWLVTRDSFASVMAEVDQQHPGRLRQISMYRFEDVRDAHLARVQRELQQLTRHIQFCQMRYDQWVSPSQAA